MPVRNLKQKQDRIPRAGQAGGCYRLFVRQVKELDGFMVRNKLWNIVWSFDVSL